MPRGDYIMLEIKDIHRTYLPKKGVPVKALDGVSLSFADKGLVFILGKSGSGKSTLLNVIGGLDVADSGEFVIKGKSSKDFSNADFDSYRNTFIGFIFQEYNILNEFSVGQNIALAMKLQGRKVTDETLNAILDEVDLSGYANRKPNELSGGQKQRVAIARALIKEPEIIMADEPTGALDSNTGRQVFDTLKKLSRDKLVIVVSHDRDFAEYYGDRVIELADGKVISDITKESAAARKESEGVSVIDDKIVHIKKGYKLTREDMEKIQSYIDRAESDTIISSDARSNESFCQIARIDKDGNQEVFRDTDNGELSKNNGKYDGSSKFIRSKLPFSHALKIGANSVKTKPFRLFVTILLCLVSFAMFGLADTIASYNSAETALNSVMDTQYKDVVFATSVKVDDIYTDLFGSSVKDLERINAAADTEFFGVAYLSQRHLSFVDSNKLYGNNSSSYYSRSIYGFLPASADNFDRYGFGTLEGKMPSDDSEIVLTEYIYEQIALAGLYTRDENDTVISGVDINDIRSFLERDPAPRIYLDGRIYKIVGIVDTNADPTGRFDSLKPSDSYKDGRSIGDMLLENECSQYFAYGYHSLGYVTQNEYSNIIDRRLNSSAAVGIAAKGDIDFSNNRDRNVFYFDSVASDAELSKKSVIWTDGRKENKLGEDEYVVSLEDAIGNDLIDDSERVVDLENVSVEFEKTYFGGAVKLKADKLRQIYRSPRISSQICYLQAAEDLTDGQAEQFRQFLKKIENYAGNDAFNNFYIRYAEDLGNLEYCIQAETSGRKITADEMSIDEIKFFYSAYLEPYNGFESTFNEENGYRSTVVDGADCGAIVEYDMAIMLFYSIMFESNTYDLEFPYIYAEVENTLGYGKTGNFKIAGFYYENAVYDDIRDELKVPRGDSILFNNEICATVKNSEPVVYSFLMAKMPKEREKVRQLIDLHYNREGDRCLTMKNGVIDTLTMIDDMLEIMGKVFLYIGLGLAVFSMLLMSNYIAVSISYKKREIGILRAVGAKSSDVYSIFFSESMIIALINFVLAVVVTALGCFFLNGMLRNDYGFQITLLIFGIRQIALMLAISVFVAIAASFLPVYALSRKKPIDTIRTG